MHQEGIELECKNPRIYPLNQDLAGSLHTRPLTTPIYTNYPQTPNSSCNQKEELLPDSDNYPNWLNDHAIVLRAGISITQLHNSNYPSRQKEAPHILMTTRRLEKIIITDHPLMHQKLLLKGLLGWK
jgi:hypothetical protein